MTREKRREKRTVQTREVEHEGKGEGREGVKPNRNSNFPKSFLNQATTRL